MVGTRVPHPRGIHRVFAGSRLLFSRRRLGLGTVALAGFAALVGGGCATWSPCDLHVCHLEDRTAGPLLASVESGSRIRALADDGLRAPRAVARSVHHGLIDCFEAGSHREDPGETHKLAYCEGSAVAFDGERLVLASDKPIPGSGRTSVFEVPVDDRAPGRAPSRYLANEVFGRARKIEDATVTPAGDRVFLTTGFDRVKAGSGEWDGYNVLMTYPAGRPEAVEVVGRGPGPHRTSVGLRELLRPHLPTAAFPEGAPYFKIEGLAAAPGRRLLFGVRELGASYRMFRYAVIILEARWSEDAEGRIALDPGSIRSLYRLDDLRVGGRQVGLSSLEYDRFRNRYFLLTSFEHEEPTPDDRPPEGEMGGFLWTLDEDALLAGERPRPVVGPTGRPLSFVNKPEGLTVLAEEHVLVLFDDDRVLSCGHPGHVHARAPHQTPVSYLELAAPPSEIASSGVTATP